MKRTIVLLYFFVLAGCGSVPASRIESTDVDASSFVQGRSYVRTAGEIVIDRYQGAWRNIFVTKSRLEFYDLEPVPAGLVFVALYSHDVSGRYLLTSPAYDDGAIAIVCDPQGGVLRQGSAIQISGARPGRAWDLIGEPGQLLVPQGFTPDPDMHYAPYEGWKLQYIGAQGTLLRFTIQELGLDRQRMGQVEYSHDLSSGKEFVFRGARLSVDGLDADSTLRYTVVGLPR